MKLDINADAGEGFGRWSFGHDEGLMEHVTSVSIAAGSHAGDPATMATAAKSARRHSVQLGVHPGRPDLVGFGRRAMAFSPQEAADLCPYQLGALSAISAREGIRVEHVKPHGALHGLVARSAGHAVASAESARFVDLDYAEDGHPDDRAGQDEARPARRR